MTDIFDSVVVVILRFAIVVILDEESVNVVVNKVVEAVVVGVSVLE